MSFPRDFTELNITVLWRPLGKVGNKEPFHIKKSKSTSSFIKTSLSKFGLFPKRKKNLL